MKEWCDDYCERYVSQLNEVKHDRWKLLSLHILLGRKEENKLNLVITQDVQGKTNESEHEQYRYRYEDERKFIDFLFCFQWKKRFLIVCSNETECSTR